MKLLTFDLPVLPRIRKFLRVHYRDRLPVVSHDPRLAQLWAMLQLEKTYIPAKGIKKTATPADQVLVCIDQYHPSRALSKQPLNEREIRMINVLLDAILYGEFAQEARRMAQMGSTASQAARQFCDRYDFSPDDLSEETLKRVWNRQQNQGQAGLVGFDDNLLSRAFQC